MRKHSVITFTSKNRTPGDCNQAGFSWHSRTFLTVCWLLALGPISREKCLLRASCAGQALGRSSLARQRLVCTQALLIYYCIKPAKCGKVLRAGRGQELLSPLVRQQARGNPLTTGFGDEARQDQSLGLNPTLPTAAGT